MVDVIIPLLTLIALEIILGTDNIIFISILVGKLPEEKRDRLRFIGLGLAVVLRLLLLAAVSWIIKLDITLFTLFTIALSGKSLILIAGGVFLLYKSTKEIYLKTELHQEGHEKMASKKISFNSLLIEIILLDLVFSIDSIITAVGLVNQLWIIYTAVIVSVGIILIASKPISNFIHRHPSFKILALSFLFLIGVALIGEGLHFEIPKGYIYFSMAFAFIVNLLQIKTKVKG